MLHTLNLAEGWAWYFTPVILATGEIEIRRLNVQDQLWEKSMIPFLNNNESKKG
jgi:hypothetical protein